jgi:hypothetical protein
VQTVEFFTVRFHMFLTNLMFFPTTVILPHKLSLCSPLKKFGLKFHCMAVMFWWLSQHVYFHTYSYWLLICEMLEQESLLVFESIKFLPSVASVCQLLSTVVKKTESMDVTCYVSS